MSKGSRNYVFTQNNYESTKMVDEIECKYCIYGKEVGESGTPHLQGFISFKDAKTKTAVIKLMPGCHIDIAKTIHEAIEYCKKDGDFTERGIPPMTQQQKGDCNIQRYKRARELAELGRFDEIDADIYIKHMGNLKKIRAEKQAKPDNLEGELDNLWIWGPPGSGKTSRAMKQYPDAYLKGLNKWWDGYTDQETVIIDDMDPYHKNLAQDFKVWAHHYAFPAETKGGTLCIRPKRIMVTSNYRIDEVWEDATTREAMHRRFMEEYVPSNLVSTDRELKL